MRVCGCIILFDPPKSDSHPLLSKCTYIFTYIYHIQQPHSHPINNDSEVITHTTTSTTTHSHQVLSPTSLQLSHNHTLNNTPPLRILELSHTTTHHTITNTLSPRILKLNQPLPISLEHSALCTLVCVCIPRISPSPPTLGWVGARARVRDMSMPLKNTRHYVACMCMCVCVYVCMCGVYINVLC